ncbi:hypothetical protein QQP08_022281 [Theobroma cacao]|nr:hypothetical protein QQP08_022281 [Theobroma cacao]
MAALPPIPGIGTAASGSGAAQGNQGFNPAMFTAASLHNAGFTAAQYVKLAKQFTMHEERIGDNLLTQGIRYGVLKLPNSSTFKDVVNFLIYLKSPAGQLAVHAEQQRSPLKRRAGEGQDISEIASAERARDEALASLRDDFRPVSLFQEPTKGELKLSCYGMYQAEGLRTCKTVLPRGDAGYAMARTMFGEIVRNARMASFATDSRNKEQLLEYMSSKTLRLEGEGQYKTAQKLRNYLVIASGAPDALGEASSASGIRSPWRGK